MYALSRAEDQMRQYEALVRVLSFYTGALCLRRHAFRLFQVRPLPKTCSTHVLSLDDSYDSASLHIIDRLERLGERMEQGFRDLSSAR
jgi:hypothetical protein